MSFTMSYLHLDHSSSVLANQITTNEANKYRIDHVTAEDMRLYTCTLHKYSLPEAQPRDKTISKEDILAAYPSLGRGLSDLSHYCACA